jgi:hypothetical protein
MEYLTEKACIKINTYLRSHINDYVELNVTNLTHSDYGYQVVIEFMHYYRMKDMYDMYMNNKRYKRKFYFKYYDYENMFKTGFNRVEMSNHLHNLRFSKNNKLNDYVSNFHFYKADKNAIMYCVTVNVLKTMYQYADYFESLKNNANEYNIDTENHYLNDMIYAFHLYYTMLNKETFLSENEMDTLLNEYHSLEDIQKVRLQLKNKDSF